ncbi:UNVERIFIED_CONTAM: hypothetical protein NCL1_09797 [Trichonephila clavipes]
MRNEATGRSKTDLPALYGSEDSSSGEPRVDTGQSCLPEEILLAFERSKNFKADTPGEGQTSKLLMNFLKEVKNDEMVELARDNFSAPISQKKKEVNKLDKFPSEAALVSTHDKNGTGTLKIATQERS